MNKLSPEAREAIEQGLRFDGPSDERRARVKARLALAIAGGTMALGGSAAAAEIARTVAVGGVTSAGKGLVLRSLLVWLGVGVTAGMGVSAVVATAAHRAARQAEVPPAPQAAAAVGAGARTSAVLSRRSPPAPLPATLSPTPSGAFAAETRPNAKALSLANAPRADAEPIASTTTTLTDEAVLLEQAQRALAANEPNRALAALAEHERRFPDGTLHEERQAARVLALCELGQKDDARALARQFVTTSPGSVLVPRLQRSCAGPF